MLPGNKARIINQVILKQERTHEESHPTDLIHWGQEEKECILQDMNRVYAFCAFAFSCFIAQLSFVLKKLLGGEVSKWKSETH